MTAKVQRALGFLVSVVLLAAGARPAAAVLPESPREVTRTASYAEVTAFLQELAKQPGVRVTDEGASVEGRRLWLVRVGPPEEETRWRILLMGQQHGTEVSGKDAILFLLRELAQPGALPSGVAVWAIPMLNPDGAEAGRRRNGADVDLNRDHLQLSQPETQALHRVARRIRPHVAVDLHEYTRDGEAWAARGWHRWPLVTMDGLNHPLFDPGVVTAAERWVARARPVMEQAGIPYDRYILGGPPPEGEQRPSTLDADDARNGLGMLGTLSLIVETGVLRRAENPDADLGERVEATLILLRHLVAETGRQRSELSRVEASRAAPLPPFLPSNAFWGNVGLQVSRFPVVERDSGQVREVATANLMHQVVVKGTVPTPAGYAVLPEGAAVYAALLERHGVPFDVLSVPQQVRAERCRLVRVEDEEDGLYQRYEGRQIVTRSPAVELELPAGSLRVTLGGDWAVRTAILLEPGMLYGLYQFPEFRKLAAPEGMLPLLRVLH